MRAGRRVRHDRDVDPQATIALRSGRSFIVIAHGAANGTVTWFRTDTQQELDWLWVGMPNAPSGARIYLYSCCAGPALTAFLPDDLLGHEGRVPIPVDNARVAVLAFLLEVERAMSVEDSGPVEWRERLVRYVNRRLAIAQEGRLSDEETVTLLMLRKSFAFADDE
jgi:hypothetical protein